MAPEVFHLEQPVVPRSDQAELNGHPNALGRRSVPVLVPERVEKVWGVKQAATAPFRLRCLRPSQSGYFEPPCRPDEPVRA